MADIALAWDGDLGEADIVVENGDLEIDQGLKTAVIISLFSDRLAESGDEIPDGSTDRRGWWGDMPLESADESTGTPDRIGSRLWLLDRALQTQDTLNRAERYANEALAWMVTDGVASSVTATASFPQRGWIKLQIVIVQASGSSTFSVQWQYS